MLDPFDIVPIPGAVDETYEVRMARLEAFFAGRLDGLHHALQVIPRWNGTEAELRRYLSNKHHDQAEAAAEAIGRYVRRAEEQKAKLHAQETS